MRIAANISGRCLQSAFERLQNSHESQKNIGAGKKRGQRVGSTPRPFLLSRGITGEAFFEIQIVSPVSERRARIVEPAATLSPTFAMNVHSGPKMTSTREPNFM